MKKIAFNLTLPLMLIMSLALISACSDDDEGSASRTETVDYYGTPVPYTLMEEKDYPEWLRDLKNEMRMMGLYRICVGTLNGETIYHLNLWTDSSLIGHLYDKDGNFVSFEGDFEDLIAQIRNVRCIYYARIGSL